MPPVLIPSPAVANEVRVSQVSIRNNLDVHLSSPPTLDELTAKYSGNYLDRVLEPVNADGKPCGPRVQIDPLHLTYLQIASTVYARPDGTTFTGAQHAWDTQIMADHHKGEGLIPAGVQAATQE